VRSAELLHSLEEYYDAAPRVSARPEAIGPFTLFVKADPEGWPFYARPRLGLDVPLTAVDVAAVRGRQKELGLPESFEWVHENTPTLLEAAREAGLQVNECPLLVLAGDGVPAADLGGSTVGLVRPDAPELADVIGAIGAGFTGTDDIVSRDPGRRPMLMRDGWLVVAGAYDGQGAIGGGCHSPRGATTELTGIAVIPRARRRGVGAAITRTLVSDARERGVETVFLSAQDDAVARVYERVGFVRVGTACIAEPPDLSVPPAPLGARHPDKSVVTRLIGGEEWRVWRDIRLRALLDTPTAFGSTYDREIAFTEPDFRDRLGASGPAVLAMAADEPVGMGAGYQDSEGWLHVVAMWGDPAWRGRRVGQMVLDVIVGWARERGLRVHLDVTTGNSAARRLYERYGFVGAGETRPLRPGSRHNIERMNLPG